MGIFKDIIINTIFKSYLEENYQRYKAKYGDKVKLIEQGGQYTILNLLNKNSEAPIDNFPSNRYNTNDIKVLKQIYINICKDFERKQLPSKEV